MFCSPRHAGGRGRATRTTLTSQASCRHDPWRSRTLARGVVSGKRRASRHIISRALAPPPMHTQPARGGAGRGGARAGGMLSVCAPAQVRGYEQERLHVHGLPHHAARAGPRPRPRTSSRMAPAPRHCALCTPAPLRNRGKESPSPRVRNAGFAVRLATARARSSTSCRASTHTARRGVWRAAKAPGGVIAPGGLQATLIALQRHSPSRAPSGACDPPPPDACATHK